MRAVGGGGSPAVSSSSSDYDGDAAWKAAIDSIAAVGFGVPLSDGAAKATRSGRESSHCDKQERPQEAQAPGLKLYQIKVRNMLDDLLEKSLEMVRTPCLDLSDTTETNGGVKLFKKAPPGITMDTACRPHVPLKRPRILPGPEADEKSKKFRHMLQSVAVDGNDIIVSAKEASERSLARLEAREAAAKLAAKKEEERVRELKKIRGEKWLPSIAREMEEEKAREQRR